MKKGLNEILKMIKDKAEEKNDEAVVKIFCDLIYKTELEDVIHINPLDKKPHFVLHKIAKSHRIEAPNEIFRYFITTSSSA